MTNPEANNNPVESISNDAQITEKLEEIHELLNQKVESWELSPEQRDNFVELWLWENPSSLNEEQNWLIDKFTNDTIQKLRESDHDAEMIKNITRTNLDNLKSDIESWDYSFQEGLKTRYWTPEETDRSEENNAVQQEWQELSQQEIRQTQLENRYSEVTIILRQKIEEAKSLLWENAEDYSVDLSLSESYDLENNISEIEQAIQKVEQDIEQIKNNEHELQQEEDDTQTNTEELTEASQEVVEEREENIQENQETQEENIWERKAEESNQQDNQEQIQESVESNEYIVQKWDNLWNITKNHYNLTKNSDIVNKIKQVIEHQDEWETKQRLVESNWDLIWVWDKIKLP